MNQMIKNALRKSLKRARLTYEELETVVMEIEAVINSQPLSYVCNEDLIEPLTPFHLMYGRHLMSPINHDDQIAENIIPARRTKYIISLLHKFWKTFNDVCLTGLRERQRITAGNISVHEGQVVLIQDKFTSRNG